MLQPHRHRFERSNTPSSRLKDTLHFSLASEMPLHGYYNDPMLQNNFAVLQSHSAL